jgi:hypothetical protein
MKKSSLFFIILALVFFISCEKDELISSSEVTEEENNSSVVLPSIVLDTVVYKDFKKLQVFKIGPNVTKGNVFTCVIGSRAVSVVAVSGDIPETIATKISSTINGAKIGVSSYTYSDPSNTFSVAGFRLSTFEAYATLY